MNALRNAYECLSMLLDFFRGIPLEWTEDGQPDTGDMPWRSELLAAAITAVAVAAASAIFPGPWFGG